MWYCVVYNRNIHNILFGIGCGFFNSCTNFFALTNSNTNSPLSISYNNES